MSFEGMDPPEVAAIADRLTGQADQIDQIATSVDAAIRSAMAAWPGPDADDFNAWWVNQHRPRLTETAQATRAAASSLRQQVADQLNVSGEGTTSVNGEDGATGPGGGVAAGVLGALGVLGQAWEGSSRWRALEGIFSGLGELSAGGEHLVRWSSPAFKFAHKGLGALGVASDLVTAVEGFVKNDGGMKVTGIAGIGATAISRVSVPLAVASNAALLYGDLTLPTNNQEYAATYDLALRRHFGDAYDPANPTAEQAAWGAARYSGPMGFLNSISDGMDYTIGSWLPWARR